MQGLAVADYFKSEWPLVVLAPSSKLFEWQDFIKAWIPNTLRNACRGDNIAKCIQVVDKGSQILTSSSLVIITTYDLISRDNPFLESLYQINAKVIIADNSHLVKSINSKRFHGAKNLLQNANRIIMLTDSPILSRPIEIFSQLQLLSPHVFDSEREFAQRYCNAYLDTFGWNYSGHSNMEELCLLVKEKLLLIQDKSSSQLTLKEREFVMLRDYLNVSPEFIQTQQEMIRTRFTLNDKYYIKNTALTNYYLETSKIKSSAVCFYLEGLLRDQSNKIVVYVNQLPMLGAIVEMLTQMNVKCIRIDGNVRFKKRYTLVKTFQEDEKCRCAIISEKSAGFALDKANVCVFADLFWTPASFSKKFSFLFDKLKI